MEECVFSGDDESQMTSVTYTPRSGEFELNENFIVLEDEKSHFRPKYNTYEISASFFCRMLSLVYCVSFVANMNQALGLFGAEGVYDANTTSLLNALNNRSFYEALAEFPSAYLLLPISNFTLRLLPLVGAVSAFLMFLTGFNCMYSFLLLWLLKLSMVALFRTLPKTPADLLLLEVGFLAIFLFTPFKFFEKQTLQVPSLVKWSFRFLAYRVVLLSGVYKVFLLKKVNIQHILMSVPLPTFLNYYLVGLVANCRLVNVLLTSLLIFFEVVLSVFLVTPYRSCRLFGGLSTLAYALSFSLLGNFGPFYFLLMLCSLFCLDDQFLYRFAHWKYNPFAKTELLMRKLSVELVDNIFDAPEPGELEEGFEDMGAGFSGNASYTGNGSYSANNNYGNSAGGSNNGYTSNATYGNSTNSTYSTNAGFSGGVAGGYGGGPVPDEFPDAAYESAENGFGSVYLNRIMSNLNYSRHREYIREFMNIDEKLSGSVVSECFRKALKDLLLLFYLVAIFAMTLLLFLFPTYRGVKALVLFLLCVLLKSHCEAVKATYLQGQYTLFLLQALLMFEMLKNGPSSWSFLLWIGLIELQLSLSKKVDNLAYLTRMIVQSFLLIHLLLYNARIFDASFRDVLKGSRAGLNAVTLSGGNAHLLHGGAMAGADVPAAAGSFIQQKSPAEGAGYVSASPENNFPVNSTKYGSNQAFGVLATHSASVNTFFTISNYKSVFPVNKERFELVLEGTTEQQVTVNTHWSEFLFKRKPSKLDGFPHFVPLYDYVLDQELVMSFNTVYYISAGSKPSNKPDENPNPDDNEANDNNSASGVPEPTEAGSAEAVDESVPTTSENGDTSNGLEDESGASSTHGHANDSDSEHKEHEHPSKRLTYTATAHPAPVKPTTDHSSVSPADRYLFDVIKALLLGSEDLTGLLAYNPFSNGKPKYVRARLYRYKFNNVPEPSDGGDHNSNAKRRSHSTKSTNGHHKASKDHGSSNWYAREFVRELVPPLSYTPPTPLPVDPSKANLGHSGHHDSSSNDGSDAHATTDTVDVTNSTGSDGKHDSDASGDSSASKEGELIHVVHTMPASNHKTVPLSMADSFNHTIPNVDGMVITSK